MAQTPTDVVNIALAEVGQRIPIASFSDGSPAANAASIFYTPKTQMLLRSANWDFARAEIALTQWKAVVINGALSTNPPPQPWQFSYLYPSDCMKMRFVQPMVTTSTTTQFLNTGPFAEFPFPPIPTACPFVPATDFDANNNPIQVILTNVPMAIGVYTRDLSEYPSLWDSLFLAGATALLGAYFANNLLRDKTQMEQQVALAKSVIDQARVATGNEGISNVDHRPDWMTARRLRGSPWFQYPTPGNGWIATGWDSCQMPNGEFY